MLVVVIVGFPLFGPSRKNSGCTFRGDPFLSPPAGYFFKFVHEKIIENLFFSNLIAPWQETFADAGDGDGDGGGGIIWNNLEPFWDHVRTVLDQV